MAADGSRWLRKATDLERMFEIGHQMQVYLTHYTLDLASAEPLDEAFFRKALTHLYRKVPVLRVCLRERDSELWLLEMEKCIIDLQIAKDVLLKEELDKMTLHTYNSEEGGSCGVSESCLWEGNPRFDMGYIHSIADGTTNVKICNLLCNIVNDLMGGLMIDDEEQLGDITGDAEVLKLYDEEVARLKENPELGAEIKRELDEGAKVRPLIRHICKVPSDVPVMTKSVTAIFSSEISDRFYRKAKLKGVSLHSALATLINLSFVKLLQEHGINQDEYNLRAGHDINIRRYYDSEKSARALGVHGPQYGYRSSFWAPRDLVPVFWETAKEFNTRFHADISSRKVLTVSAYRMRNENTSQNFREMFRTDGEPNYYYTISNMGNLSGALFEGGQYVALKKLTRFSSLRNGNSFMCIYIHTFRNQLNLTYAYSSRFLSHDTVERLADLFEINLPLVCDI
ncbi:uncharacterized protein LOC135218958 [Macrobrachium nipponense]|uniref:uncharacterized protein LOC135218958 n=1 Tax=Macrobrachium nipponense TaxID=159736 RepID=UPI0030C84149